jgi:hypothetical protein
VTGRKVRATAQIGALQAPETAQKLMRYLPRRGTENEEIE